MIKLKKVATEVSPTDKAALALPKWLIKFEILPPGQAATRIIPKAILGWGSKRLIKMKVRKGSSKNWLKRPSTAGLGFLRMILKSSNRISRAMPNMIMARQILRRNNESALKFSRIASMSCMFGGIKPQIRLSRLECQFYWAFSLRLISNTAGQSEAFFSVKLRIWCMRLRSVCGYSRQAFGRTS